MSAKLCAYKVGEWVACIWDEPYPGDSGDAPVQIVKVYWAPKSGWWLKLSNGARCSQECVVEVFESAEAIA